MDQRNVVIAHFMQYASQRGLFAQSISVLFRLDKLPHANYAQVRFFYGGVVEIVIPVISAVFPNIMEIFISGQCFFIVFFRREERDLV